MTARKRERELAEKLSVSISRAVSPEGSVNSRDVNKDEVNDKSDKSIDQITAGDIEKLIKKKK